MKYITILALFGTLAVASEPSDAMKFQLEKQRSTFYQLQAQLGEIQNRIKAAAEKFNTDFTAAGAACESKQLDNETLSCLPLPKDDTAEANKAADKSKGKK